MSDICEKIRKYVPVGPIQHVYLPRVVTGPALPIHAVSLSSAVRRIITLSWLNGSYGRPGDDTLASYAYHLSKASKWYTDEKRSTNQLRPFRKLSALSGAYDSR